MTTDPTAGSATGAPVPAPPLLTAARERVVAALCDQFAHDNLSVEQLEQRLELAYKAQSVAEFDTLLADLPALAEPAPLTPLATAAPATMPERWAADVPAHARIVSLMSETKRHGDWALPRSLEVIAAMSAAHIDLRNAQLGAGTSDIHIVAVMADVKIHVPPGVRLECQGSAIMGVFSADAGAEPALPNAPVIRFTGYSIMSDVQTDHGESAENEEQLERSKAQRLSDGRKV